MLSYQTFVTFPSLSYLLTLCCFTNFCRLIKLLSFSTLVFYSLFYVTYAPYECTCCTHHTNNPLSRLTVRMLSANTLSQLTSRLWPSCHFDLGGSRCGWGGGGSRRTTRYLHFHATRAKIDIAVTLKQNREDQPFPAPITRIVTTRARMGTVRHRTIVSISPQWVNRYHRRKVALPTRNV